MSYRSIKWLIFTALIMTVPALLFLVQVVMFIPAIFFAAGIVYVIPKALTPGHATESLWFIAFLGTHFLVYVAVYYAVSVLAAKAISMIQARLGRNLAVGAICIGFGLLTQFPVYGSGGHSPISWVSLGKVFSDVNKSYGAGTVEVVYGISILLICAVLLLRKRLPGRSRTGLSLRR